MLLRQKAYVLPVKDTVVDVAERILTEPRAEEAITGPAQSADLDVQTVMR